MLRRLVHATRGVALIEFALCLPVLIVLYLGGYAALDMISSTRKVTTATRSLVDLVSRTMSPAIIYNSPQDANATSYLSAAAVALAPYKLNNATAQISLLRICDATHAYVVWTQAQTQTVDGSIVSAATSTLTAGTLPANQTQSAPTVVSIPGTMVTSPVVPASPDGSNVCGNFAPSTSTKTQVGTAGGWLFVGTVKYRYTPSINFLSLPTTMLTDTIYMSPRLY
ncbi:TadE/TadG family type IV pilus assembly protein [Sphingomonas sp. UYP23]